MIDARYADRTIRKADKGYHLKKLYYNTDDIIEEVLWAEKQNIKADTKEFSKAITPDFLGMQDLYDFLLQEIEYKADPKGAQWVKSPARFWNDRKGDCKSYTVYIISVLQNLGLGYRICFANYHKKYRDTAKHVYPIAILPDGQEVVMDVVYEVQHPGVGAFNVEKPWNHKTSYMRKGLAYLTGTEEEERHDQVLDAIAEILETIPETVKHGGDVTRMSEGELQRFLMAQRLEIAADQENRYARSQNLRLAASVVRAGNTAAIGSIAGPEQGEVRNFLNRTRYMTAPAFNAPTLRFRTPPDIGGLFDFFKRIGKGIADGVSKVVKGAGDAVKAVGDFFKEAWARLMNWIFKGPLQKAGPFFLFTFIKDNKGVPEIKRRQGKQQGVLNFFRKVGMKMNNIDAAIKNGIIENMGSDPKALINKAAGGTIAGEDEKVGAVSAVIAAVGFIVEIIQKIANLFKKKDEQPAVTEGDTSELQLIEGLANKKQQADTGGGGALIPLGAGALALAIFS